MKRILAFLLMIAVSFSVLLLPCAAAASYPFYDVRKTAWYANAVRYVYQNHLFAGTDATTFSPENYLTRAMLVSVLWRREGSPEVSEENPFWDVPDGTWYTKGVVWAASQGIVSGTGNGMFEPSADITREQLAAIMMRSIRGIFRSMWSPERIFPRLPMRILSALGHARRCPGQMPRAF